MTNYVQNVELACNNAAKRLEHARARIAQGDTTNANYEIQAAADALATAKRDLALAQIEMESVSGALSLLDGFRKKHEEDY